MNDTKEIRKQMKAELGYNARQVSVKSTYSRITFTIRDASVNKKKVEMFAAQFESYERDCATGEILCGGNTFVQVQYAEEVKNQLIESVIDRVAAAAERSSESTIVTVEGTDFSVSKCPYGGFKVWSDISNMMVQDCYNIKNAALAVATL